LVSGCGLDSTGSGQGPVVDCYECGEEPSGSCATQSVSYCRRGKGKARLTCCLHLLIASMAMFVLDMCPARCISQYMVLVSQTSLLKLLQIHENIKYDRLQLISQLNIFSFIVRFATKFELNLLTNEEKQL
jgi:hypothetical protein